MMCKNCCKEKTFREILDCKGWSLLLFFFCPISIKSSVSEQDHSSIWYGRNEDQGRRGSSGKTCTSIFIQFFFILLIFVIFVTGHRIVLHTKNSSKAAFDQKIKEMEERTSENGTQGTVTGNACLDKTQEPIQGTVTGNTCQDKTQEPTQGLCGDQEDRLSPECQTVNSEEKMDSSCDVVCDSRNITLMSRTITVAEDTSFKEGMG